MFVYVTGLVILIIICGLLHMKTRSASNAVKEVNLRKFEQLYLVVYLLAMSKFDVADHSPEEGAKKSAFVFMLTFLLSSGRLAPGATRLRAL